MKKFLTFLSALSFLCLLFFVGCYYVGGYGYHFVTRKVVIAVRLFWLATVLCGVLVVGLNILMHKSETILRAISTILVVLFIPAAFFGAWISMLMVAVCGPYGCSYTENIADYNGSERGEALAHFPDEITEDMTVLKYTDYYKDMDVGQLDVYLEVQFDNKETMEIYLNKATEAFSEYGYVSYPNAFHEDFTDILGKHPYKKDLVTGYQLYDHIGFFNEPSYNYVDMHYISITYSYESLTIIYNCTDINSEIIIGDVPENGEYYPQFLKRFQVEWDYKKSFSYRGPIEN